MKDIHAEGTLTRDEHSTQSLYIKRDTHGHARSDGRALHAHQRTLAMSNNGKVATGEHNAD